MDFDFLFSLKWLIDAWLWTGMEHIKNNESQSGFVISVAWQVISIINEGIRYKNQAKNRDNDVLQALEAYRAKKAFDGAKDTGKAKSRTPWDT